MKSRAAWFSFESLSIMKAFRRYSAPLSGPLMLVICSVPVALSFAWIMLVVPRLSARISLLEDSSPVICSILQGVIRFVMLPVWMISTFLMVHFYRRYYEQKKRERDRNA